MVVNTSALIIVIGYLVGMLVVGYVVGKLKIQGAEDYMLAGRRMGIFMVAFSLSANNIGGGCTTGLVSGRRRLQIQRFSRRNNNRQLADSA